MFLHISSCDEAFLTDHTLEGLLVGVGAQVHLEVGPFRKVLVAVGKWTHVLDRLKVELLMLKKLGFFGKLLVAGREHAIKL